MALIENHYEAPRFIRDPRGSEKCLDPRQIIMANLYATWDIDSKSYKMEVEAFKKARNDYERYSELDIFFIICQYRADCIFDDQWMMRDIDKRWERR